MVDNGKERFILSVWGCERGRYVPIITFEGVKLDRDKKACLVKELTKQPAQP